MPHSNSTGTPLSGIRIAEAQGRAMYADSWMDVMSTPNTNPSRDTGSDPVFEARRDRLWITFSVIATFLLVLGGIALFWLRDGNGTQAAYTLGLVLFLIIFNVWYYQR